MINIPSNEVQISFDFESKQLYGLKHIEDGFLRVYYSGLSRGLLFLYNTTSEAETARKKYTHSEDYTVEIVPENLIAVDNLKLLERLENLV